MTDYSALQASIQAGENEEQFIQRVLGEMPNFNINPYAPHRNQ